uniref:Neprilysin n=1 Tax=Hemiscolopendra marginata TaxID=943146 RepID=A0A646QIG5_9MYRI
MFLNTELKLWLLRGLLLFLIYIHQDNAMTVEGNSSVHQNQSSPCKTLGCNITDNAMTVEGNSSVHQKQSSPCITLGCNKTANMLLEYMDTNQDPCDDFYRFACGGFQEKYSNAGYNVYNKLILQREMKYILKKLLTCKELKGKPKIFSKMRNYYSACLKAPFDRQTQVKGLLQLLDEFGGWPILKGDSWQKASFSWLDASAKLVSKGLPRTSILGFRLREDQLSFMPNKFHITILLAFKKSDKNKNEILIRTLVKEVAEYLNASGKDVDKEIRKMINFYQTYTETYEEEINDTELYPNSTMPVSYLYSISSKIDWLTYLRQMFPAANINNNTIITDYQSSWTKLKAALKSIQSTDSRILANFILWQAIFDTIELLQVPKFSETKRNIRKNIPDSSTKNKQWVQCIADMDEFLTPALSSLYARDYFTENDKKRVEWLYEWIEDSALKLLRNADWLDSFTKDNLLFKLTNMKTVIAYGIEIMNDTILDNYYENLSISKNEHFWNNIQLRKFHHDAISELIVPNATDKYWLNMESLLKSYISLSPITNSLFFPLTYLRGVYFAPSRLYALDFGSLGSQFGYIFYGGISEFDERSLEFSSWSLEATNELFNRSQCTIERESKFQHTINTTEYQQNGTNNTENQQTETNTTENQQQWNKHQNSSTKRIKFLELSRKIPLLNNLNTNFGLKVAYMAYQNLFELIGEERPLFNLTKYSSKQLFWISFANSMCSSKNYYKSYDTKLSNMHRSDVLKRAFNSIKNMEEFAQDFGCAAGSPMNPIKKCIVW